MSIIKRMHRQFYLGLLIGCLIAITSILFLKRVESNLVDTYVDMDHAAMKVLGEKIEAYKNHCKVYPTEEEGLEALTEKSSNTCYPQNERIKGGIPGNSEDIEFIYHLRNQRVFLFSLLNKKSYWSSEGQ